MILSLLAILTLLLPPESPLGARHPSPGFELQNGDSVVLLGNTFIEQDRHFGLTEMMLRSRFPGTRFSIRNLAWAGDTTQVRMRPLNFGSMEEYIHQQSPTIIFVSYGMSESFDGQPGLAAYLDGYREILDMLSKTGAQIVILSPIRHERLGPPLPDPSEHNRNLELYVEATRKLAEEQGHRFVDLFNALIQPSEVPVSQPLTTNGIHLSEYGYWRASEAIAEQLGLPPSKWQLQVEPNGGSVRFKGPASDQARLLQERINRRDRLFFYRWRPHNAEYIYGRRTTTQFGQVFERKFSAEAKEFERLIQQADEEINDLGQLLLRER